MLFLNSIDTKNNNILDYDLRKQIGSLDASASNDFIDNTLI